ncbi:S8 family serine peptidase [Flavivirga rizhaonensis]|uniref:T9SS type A sorting domain-containing protein n=1 Tax=Flavivirga rizhaonensis TaxID=2559571 RepID=A0A4S1DWN7_9FLAO|nr:S8 family serine peptidase [Flavivirga rizhaonensis]TGV02556.1 T9SS type A sorting domain-containing protein [Flavivirga rizhaonensis]
MKTNNNIFLALFFLIGSIAFGQENFSFYVEIPDVNKIPVMTHSASGARMTYSKTQNRELDKLVNSYKIYNCKKVFDNSNKSSLQNIYLIECNDLKLMNQLYDRFKQFYPRVEDASAQTLYVPNDFGTTGGYTGIDQEELNYIRAPETWDLLDIANGGSNNVIIGIADNDFNTNHEDLLNRIEVVYGNNNPNATGTNNANHGTYVSSMASANTDNGIGMSAIGFYAKIYAAAKSRSDGLDALSQMAGVKVVNASWGLSSFSPPSITPIVYEGINDRGVVVVAAAGNGLDSGSNSTNYYIPASYKDVISVSAVGHKNYISGSTETFVDSHAYLKNGQIGSYQHNDSIDIVAPAYGVLVANREWGGPYGQYNQDYYGTSFAAPMVSGTVALMFDVNYCIDPKEVETILKLTAVKIDHLPQNIQYYGKLGAGKLDAYEAVKMAKDMADAFGTVEVKDRILYRPWFYKLETAPYEIKMTNNDVTGGSKLKFNARNNIEVLSGDYHPSTGGYIDLSIDSNLALDCLPPPSSSKNTKTKINSIEGNILESSENRLLVFPNPTTGALNIINKDGLNEITISDITGKSVYHVKDLNYNQLQINMSKFNSGIYFIKIRTKTGYIIDRKIIKE